MIISEKVIMSFPLKGQYQTDKNKRSIGDKYEHMIYEHLGSLETNEHIWDQFKYLYTFESSKMNKIKQNKVKKDKIKWKKKYKIR